MLEFVIKSHLIKSDFSLNSNFLMKLISQFISKTSTILKTFPGKNGKEF